MASFCDRGGLKLKSGCTKVGNIMYLTQQRGNQVGALWMLEAIDITKSFTVKFDFIVSGGNDGHGDGLAFVVQGVGNSEIGENGSNIGYGGLLKNGIALEIDTHMNADLSDPDDNHISFHVSDGATAMNAHEKTAFSKYLSIPKSTVTFTDGKKHSARIDYEVTTQTFSAQIDSSATLEYKLSKNFTQIVGANDGFFGFTAATGGYAEAHQLLSFSIDSNGATECLPGFTGTNCDKEPTSGNCKAYKSCGQCTQSITCCAWCDGSCKNEDEKLCPVVDCPVKHKHSVVWWGIGIVVAVLCLCVVALFVYWRRTRVRSRAYSSADPILDTDDASDAQAQYSQL